MKKIYIALLLVFILGFGLRFYALSLNPSGLYFDEMALGYNAYSLAETGADEHGIKWPLVYFTSFGDYKPSAYVYFLLPLVKVFGLSGYVTRVPSALAGSLTVLFCFFLLKELLRFSKLNQKDISIVALLSSLVLAVSPWHIQLSRVAYEANLACFFNILAILFLLKARSNFKYLILSVLMACMAVYSFNSFRIFTPLLFISTFLLAFVFEKKNNFVKNISKNALVLFFSGLIILLFSIPLISHLSSKEGRLRFTEVNIFNNLDIVRESNDLITQDNNSILAKVVHNRRLGMAKLFLQHYFDHFRFDYLFLYGDINPRINSGFTGQLYLIESLFLLIGAFYFIKNRTKSSLFIALWLVLGILPAAMARETPHALRTITTLPIWQILIALGLYRLYQRLSVKTWSRYALALLLFFYLGSILLFLHNYFSHYRLKSADAWFDGFDQAAIYAYKNREKYNQVYIQLEGRGYIAYLFYNQVDPREFQEGEKDYPDRSLLAGNAYVATKFNQIYFSIPDKIQSNSLIIAKKEEIPSGGSIIKEFMSITGEPAYVAAEL